MLAGAEQPPAKKRRIKKKVLSPVDELRNAIRWATRTKDPALGLWAYDEALRRGVAVPEDAWVGVLYLCAGGALWVVFLQPMLLLGITPCFPPCFQ